MTFDARDALEKTSENMERMTVLMDKMYIKLDQKKCPISPRYIKEVEDRIVDSLDEEIIGEDIDLLVEIIMKVIEDMEEEEVICREVTFREVIFEVDIIVIQVEIGKMEGHGDNLGQEKEKGELGHHLVLDWDQGPVQTEIGLGLLNVESKIILQMNVQI